MNLVFNENLREVLGDLAKVDAGIEQIRELCRPVLNGEHYLSGEEVCKALRITKRTLQQYRDDGLVSYVALPGKMLYKESDILALLQQNYIPAFMHENRDFLFGNDAKSATFCIITFYFPEKRKKSAVYDRLWWGKRWSKQVFQTSPY